jgi:hypothetical protein
MAGQKNKHNDVQEKPTGASLTSLVSGCSSVRVEYAKLFISPQFFILTCFILIYQQLKSSFGKLGIHNL